jgi:hypothetical protein
MLIFTHIEELQLEKMEGIYQSVKENTRFKA